MVYLIPQPIGIAIGKYSTLSFDTLVYLRHSQNFN